MSGLEAFLDEHGVGIAIGGIMGVVFLLCLIAAIAFADRRPPDKRG